MPSATSALNVIVISRFAASSLCAALHASLASLSSNVARCVVPPKPVARQNILYNGTDAYVAPTTAATSAKRYFAKSAFFASFGSFARRFPPLVDAAKPLFVDANVDEKASLIGVFARAPRANRRVATKTDGFDTTVDVVAHRTVARSAENAPRRVVDIAQLRVTCHECKSENLNMKLIRSVDTTSRTRERCRRRHTRRRNWRD